MHGCDSPPMSRKPGNSAYLRRGYLAPSERVLFETHPSKWFWFPAPVAYLAVVGFATYASATSVYSRLPAVWGVSAFIERFLPSSHAGLPDPRVLLLIVCTVAMLAGVVWMFALIYDWVSDTYVLTDDRIIEQKGIIRTVQEDIPLNQIRDVLVDQRSWTSRLLRFGNVEFTSLSQLDITDITYESRPASTPRVPESEPPKAVSHHRYSLYRWNPRSQESRDSGVESWIGVPTPVRIERLVEQALRDRSTGPPKPPGYPAVV